MGLRHISLLTLADGCDLEATVEALRALPAAIPEIRSYTVGRDAGLSEGNATIAVVADFDDETGWATYRDHPAHQQVLADHLKPWLVARTAIQHRR